MPLGSRCVARRPYQSWSGSGKSWIACRSSCCRSRRLHKQTYALDQWQALCRYTEDGRLTIDNNMSERRLRDQAIGRKNWLFLGSDEAGPRAAVLCTILAGAKRHRLEPWAYLHDVILQVAVDASPEMLARLLPDRWALAHPEHILSHRLEESRQ